jgi:uncharacterized protein YjbI with pentapeptide repeats
VLFVRGCEIRRDSVCTEWNLSNADLEGRRLDRVNFQGSNLQGANLRGVIFDSANLHQTDLRGADLQGGAVRESSVTGALFCGTRWTDGTIKDDDC